MSIIIRLQNLPWSANAENIRQFFGNLVIPDGGVHIVGGEHGDAFIAFGSDEDARQAMAKDGGDIKGVKIRLLLSSRVEMQKVIDTARQQALTSSQNLLQNLQQHQYDPSAAAIPVNLPPNLLSMLPGLVNLPGMNSLPMMPNVPTIPNLPPMPGMPAGLAQMPFTMPVTTTATPVTTNTKPMPASSLPTIPRAAINAETADKKKENTAQPMSRTQKSSKSRSRSRSRSRDRRGYRDKYRSRDGRSGDRKYRRDRSKSRERDKKSDRSRSRDRYRRRSRSRERRNDDRSRDYRNRSKERRRDSDRSSAKKDSNSAEAAVNAAKAPFKTSGSNNVASVPLPGAKPGANEIKIPGLGDKSLSNSATPPMTAVAKNSPSIDPAKSAADLKAAWPPMVPPTAPTWSAAIPTPSESKSTADSPKTTGSSASTAAVTSAATMPQMPSIPGMPTLPNMSAMGASMASMSSLPYNMAAAYSMAYAGASNMYGMNRFPLTAQQAAAMYPGYPMSMMTQPSYGQYPPTASPTQAAATPKPAAQQPEPVEPANMKPRIENHIDEEDEEEEVDCFGRVRKKSRRPSYSPEKVSSNYENGDRYDRRDPYKSRGDSSYNKSFRRDSYNHDDNRYHRGESDDGSFRKPPYRRGFDRHDGGGDDWPRGGFDRRNENTGSDRRNFQSRFDGRGDERNAAPYDSRNEQPTSRHSKFDEQRRTHQQSSAQFQPLRRSKS